MTKETAPDITFIDYTPDPTVITAPTPAVVTAPSITIPQPVTTESTSIYNLFTHASLAVTQSDPVADPHAPINNPIFTGTVMLPAITDNTLSDNTAATTNFCQTVVSSKISNLIDGAPSQLDTLNELASALNNDMNFGSAVVSSLNVRYTKTETDTLLDAKFNKTANLPISQVTDLQTSLTSKADASNPTLSGIVTTPGQYYVMWLINSGAAPVDSNVATTVPFNYLHSSRGGNTLWDSVNQRFVLPVAGVWRIDFGVTFQQTSAASRVILSMKVNGVGRAETQAGKSTNAGGWNMSAAVLVSANDYVELTVSHDASTVTNLPTTGGTGMAYRDRTSSPCTYAIFSFVG